MRKLFSLIVGGCYLIGVAIYAAVWIVSVVPVKFILSRRSYRTIMYYCT